MNEKALSTLEAVDDLIADALLNSLRAKQLLRSLDESQGLPPEHGEFTADMTRRSSGLFWHASQASLYLDRARVDIADMVAEAPTVPGVAA